METFPEAAASLLGLALTPEQNRRFEIYASELVEWNGRANLTAITDPRGIQVKHFLDSLSCWLALAGTPARRVIDVGTGAGFPGLPLKILAPSIELTLLEATRKKVDFCRHVVEVLGLRHVQVVHGRAEELGRDPDHRERYDWALARAVAELPTLVEYLLPFVRVGGSAIAQKGESGPSEAQAAARSLHLLGGTLSKVVRVELPGVAETRYLVVMAKVASTPERYPRRSGLPGKKPLG